MRDEFPENIKRNLCDRVGGYCSNPSCKKPTTGPHSDPDKRVSTGQAAHITAASAGGPRYDPFLTSEQRSSAENGIWLCDICARMIDADPIKYSVEELKSWKIQAESEQYERLVNPINMSVNAAATFTAGIPTADPVNAVNQAVPVNPTKLANQMNLANPMNPTNSSIRDVWNNLYNAIYEYQAAMDEAYKYWELNFKRFNSYELFCEIQGSHWYLYEEDLNNMYNIWVNRGQRIGVARTALVLDMSDELAGCIERYEHLMDFHYEYDQLGMNNEYWMRFFETVSANYGAMKDLSNKVLDLIRAEYKGNTE